MLLSARNQFNDEDREPKPTAVFVRGENCCGAKSSIDANSPALLCDSLRSPFNSTATALKRRC
jgi:hypothetical protein